MSLKDSLDKGLDAIKKGVHDVEDRISEATHKSNADAEQAKRDVAGDTMTTGEKVDSVVNQGVENVQAGYAATKRDVRDNLT